MDLETKTTQQRPEIAEDVRTTNSGLDRRDPVAFALRNSALLMRRFEVCRDAEARKGRLVTTALDPEATMLSVPGAILRSVAEYCGDYTVPQYDVAEPVHDFLCEFLNTNDLYRWSLYVIDKEHAQKVFTEAAEAREKVLRVN